MMSVGYLVMSVGEDFNDNYKDISTVRKLLSNMYILIIYLNYTPIFSTNFSFSYPDKTYWQEQVSDGSKMVSIEATSYALLTLLKLKAQGSIDPVVRWLTEQRFYGEIYVSTQVSHGGLTKRIFSLFLNCSHHPKTPTQHLTRPSSYWLLDF